MPSRGSTACAALVATLSAACCPGVDPSHWSGTLNYSVTVVADASSGAQGPTMTGATSLSVTLDAYQPWKDNSLDYSYCGSSTFTVELGPSCSLKADVGSSYPYSGSIEAGQSCGLQLPNVWVSFVVQSGSVVYSSPGVNITLGGEGSNLEFEGS